MAERNVVTRVARDDDLDLIVSHYGPGGGDSPWDPFADRERIRRIGRNGLLVALVDGAYAGFLYWYEAGKPWYDPTVDQFARISDLHVVPAFQGQGVGRHLLNTALDAIRTRGVPVVFLETDEENTRARALYEKAGFLMFKHVIRYRLPLSDSA